MIDVECETIELDDGSSVYACDFLRCPDDLPRTDPNHLPCELVLSCGWYDDQLMPECHSWDSGDFPVDAGDLSRDAPRDADGASDLKRCCPGTTTSREGATCHLTSLMQCAPGYYAPNCGNGKLTCDEVISVNPPVATGCTCVGNGGET